MINIIRVNKIRMHAYHGCLEEEARIGGHYEVNVVLHTDFMEAAQSDNLEKTIDYVHVNRIVKEEMAIRSKLIEDVALRIHTRFKAELKKLKKASVEIVKLSPPINGDVESVSVILED